MKRVDLCLAHFSKQGQRNTFMSAKSSEPFVTGDATSDYLGFFGFGSGTIESKGCPEHVKNYINFDLPCLDSDASSVYPALVNVLQALSRINIIPDTNEVRELVKEIARSGGHLPSSVDDSINDAMTYLTPIDHNAKIGDPAYPSMLTFSVRNGKRFLSFGIHDFDDVYSKLCRDLSYPYGVWSDGQIPGFNWDYYTQLGAHQHSTSLLKALRRHRFVSDWDECKGIIDKTIYALDTFYRKL